MVALPNAFNAQNYDPTQNVGGNLPIGRHPVVITGSELKGTKDNNGSGYLQFDLSVIDGPAKGQTGAYRLNLYNQSQQAVEIAHRQFSALCHVIGVYMVQNTEVLYNRPFVIDVGLQRGQAENGYTEIKKVLDMNGNEPGKPPSQGAATPQAGFGGAPQGQPAQNWQQPQGQPQAGPQGGGWGNPPAGQGAPAAGFQPPQGQPPQGGGWTPPQGGQQQPQQPQGGAPGWQPPGGAPQGPPQGQPQNQGWQPPQGGAPQGGAPAWAQR